MQFLTQNIRRLNKRFVEFGVQTYAESNTRFLMTHNAWTGLVMDTQSNYVDLIRDAFPGWKYDLIVRKAHVTRDNINDILREEKFEGEIGLLSIDVDSVDCYIWKAIDVINPAIVIVEYNRNFPFDRPIAIPYEEVFDRTEKHTSNLYWGASISALVHIGTLKGYQFIGTESHQRNAFFVRRDLMREGIPRDVPRDVHQHATVADSVKILAGMSVYNVVTEQIEVL